MAYQRKGKHGHFRMVAHRVHHSTLMVRGLCSRSAGAAVLERRPSPIVARQRAVLRFGGRALASASHVRASRRRASRARERPRESASSTLGLVQSREDAARRKRGPARAPVVAGSSRPHGGGQAPGRPRRCIRRGGCAGGSMVGARAGPRGSAREGCCVWRVSPCVDGAEDRRAGGRAGPGQAGRAGRLGCRACRRAGGRKAGVSAGRAGAGGCLSGRTWPILA